MLINYLYCPLQVIGFVQKLTDLLPDYEIACEHEHSNCLLIAHKKVRQSSSSMNNQLYRLCNDVFT